jgi:hypothetical protein
MTDYRDLPLDELYLRREARSTALLASLSGETRETALEVIELWRETTTRLSEWAAWQRFVGGPERRTERETAGEQMELAL